jgi:hypothetical protein
MIEPEQSIRKERAGRRGNLLPALHNLSGGIGGNGLRPWMLEYTSFALRLYNLHSGFTQFFGHNPVVSFCRGEKGEVGARVRAQGRGAVPGLFFGRSALMELACGLTRRSSGRLERAPEVQLGAAGGPD